MQESQKSNCLLSAAVIPKNYNLWISPNLENFIFNGKVFVSIDICETVREIVLHAADLEIKAADVTVLFNSNSLSVVCQEVRFNQEAETVTFIFAEDLPVGNALLKIHYTGVLNDKNAGFYRSKYTAADGQTKYLATTQFEATDARRALPCWDEPARKATFDVTLIVPNNLVALSNMPVQEIVPLANSDLQIISFGRTPIMSTYLLAFVVGEFDFVETHTNNGTLVRVYALPGRSDQGKFALDVGKRSLEFYNSYFDIPYPLPKLDMIAIPDFASGAMENWGLVTYRENALLIDEANSSIASKQRVAEVVAHELAHQWFGNLVTMEWWTNLWLNEGFASWMANFVMDKLFPEWDIWTQFLSDDYNDAMSLDSLRSSHAIEIPVGHPNEISQIFDAISYSKGASVIRMIHDFIGADAFRAGMQIYLKRHAYANTITEDLWNALGEASGHPVQKIMDSWIKQAGYPLVKISRNDQNNLVLSQKRFLASGEDLSEVESAQQWQTPLVLEFNDSGKNYYEKIVLSADTEINESTKVFSSLTQERKQVFSPLARLENKFLKFNSGQVALARVNYLPEQWQALAEAIRRGKLVPADRYGIISDALALARAGHMSTGQLINLISSYKNEDNHTVWMAILGALGALNNILEETSEGLRFASFARSVLAPIAGKLGWTEVASEFHTTKLMRTHILSAMGNYGDLDIIAEAKNRFRSHVSNLQVADPNFRPVIYGLTAKYGSKVEFDAMVEMYRKETFQEEKARLLGAFGKFASPDLLPAVLEYAFNSGDVRHSDFIYVAGSMGSHANGRRIAWKFLTDNWEIINERYSGGGLKMLGRIIALVCDGFARTKDAEMVEQFFANHPAPSATRAIAESIERISVRASWHERDKDEIAEALKLYLKG